MCAVFFSFLFSVEMSHKKRRESTKKTGDDHRLSLAETTRKNSVFYDIYIVRVFITRRAPVFIPRGARERHHHHPHIVVIE
jgi:hypothetical protein